MQLMYNQDDWFIKGNKKTLFIYSCSKLNFRCPIDPTVIEIPINSFPFSIHQFSFYLYHIIKEPIPFQIQCKILYNDDQIEIPNNTDCSTSFINNNHNDRLSIHKNDKRDYVFRSYHSSKVCVTRPPAPSDKIEREKIESKNSNNYNN